MSSTMSLKSSDSRKQWWHDYSLDDFNFNETVRNLIMNQISSIIFHRNYLFCMIQYDTQVAYRRTKSHMKSIQAVNRMSQLIDSRRFKRLTDEQRMSLRQKAEIKKLCHHRDQLYHCIRTSKFKFLYQAKEESIHDEYQKVKRVVNRLIKAWDWTLKKQVQAKYDVIASMNDIQAQLEENAKSIDQTVFIFESIQYAFVKRACIAQIFFNSSSAFNVENNVSWRVSIVNDLMSLCSLQESRFRKVSWRRRIQVIKCDLKNVDVKYILNAVTFKSAESESQISHLFSLRCKQYQCLHCLENRSLSLNERLHNLDSKFSLRRHFDRCHIFQSGKFCSFSRFECAVVTLNSMMHFKNHAIKIHEIYMLKKM